MSELADRKRLLLAQAELQRHVLALEAARVRNGASAVRGFVSGRRWWLLGGAVLVGVVLARRGRQLLGCVPTALSLWRTLRG